MTKASCLFCDYRPREGSLYCRHHDPSVEAENERLRAALDDVDAILSGWRRGIDSGHYIDSGNVKRLRRFVQDVLGWNDDDVQVSRLPEKQEEGTMSTRVQVAVDALHSREGTGCEHFSDGPAPDLVCDWHKMEAVVAALDEHDPGQRRTP